MIKGVAILGAGGSGRTIYACLKRQVEHAGLRLNVVFFDESEHLIGNVIGECLVEPMSRLDEYSGYEVLVSFASPSVRKRWVEYCTDLGFNFYAFCDPSHIAYEKLQLESGTVLLAGSLSSVNVKIGQHVQINIYSYIEHDCVIGDFVTMAPKVCCNGWVIVEDGAYIGSGALIRDGSYRKPIVIGRNSVIGMGAVVTKSVLANTTVVGNPAGICEIK